MKNKKLQFKILNSHSQRGEIATTLTLISLGLMAFGALVGSFAVQRRTQISSQATSSEITVEVADLTYNTNSNSYTIAGTICFNFADGQSHSMRVWAETGNYVKGSGSASLYIWRSCAQGSPYHEFSFNVSMTDSWKNTSSPCPPANTNIIIDIEILPYGDFGLYSGAATVTVQRPNECSGLTATPTLTGAPVPTVTGTPAATPTVTIPPATPTSTPTLTPAITPTPRPGSPTLSVNPDHLTFTATQEGSNPPNQDLTITNTGGGTLSWGATKNANWITLSPTSGFTTTSTTLHVGVNISGLVPQGPINGEITIVNAGPGGGGQDKIVTVTLTVTAQVATATPSPTGCQLPNAAPSFVNLSGFVDPNPRTFVEIEDESTNEDVFELYRDTNSNFTPSASNKVGGQNSQDTLHTGAIYGFHDNNLSCNTTYYYKAAAVNPCGSTFSGVYPATGFSFVCPAPTATPTTQPGAPTATPTPTATVTPTVTPTPTRLPAGQAGCDATCETCGWRNADGTCSTNDTLRFKCCHRECQGPANDQHFCLTVFNSGGYQDHEENNTCTDDNSAPQGGLRDISCYGPTVTPTSPPGNPPTSTPTRAPGVPTDTPTPTVTPTPPQSLCAQSGYPCMTESYCSAGGGSNNSGICNAGNNNCGCGTEVCCSGWKSCIYAGYVCKTATECTAGGGTDRSGVCGEGNCGCPSDKVCCSGWVPPVTHYGCTNVGGAQEYQCTVIEGSSNRDGCTSLGQDCTPGGGGATISGNVAVNNPGNVPITALWVQINTGVSGLSIPPVSLPASGGHFSFTDNEIVAGYEYMVEAIACEDGCEYYMGWTYQEVTAPASNVSLTLNIPAPLSCTAGTDGGCGGDCGGSSASCFAGNCMTLTGSCSPPCLAGQRCWFNYECSTTECHKTSDDFCFADPQCVGATATPTPPSSGLSCADRGGLCKTSCHTADSDCRKIEDQVATCPEFLFLPQRPCCKPRGCGKSCTYSQQDEDGIVRCYSGNCLDCSQDCGFNQNCGFVPHCSPGGPSVSCPGTTGLFFSADVNEDGVVNLNDWSWALAHYGEIMEKPKGKFVLNALTLSRIIISLSH